MKYLGTIFVLLLLCATGAGAQTRLNIWANEGGDKVTRDELRASANPAAVINSAWNGASIHLFGARNEVISANLVIEAPEGAQNVSVTFDTLTGPGGAKINSKPVQGDGVFDWTNREIELFYIRYLQLKGLTLNGFEHYDERHIPRRMRRPFDPATGIGTGSWSSRPDHDKYYPDIAVPYELVNRFDIPSGQNQSIWVDIYLPKTAPAGSYSGTITVHADGRADTAVPISVDVRNFTLPDKPTSKTMAVFDPPNINTRFFGVNYVSTQGSDGPRSIKIRNRYFELAHRHKISLVDTNYDYTGDQPSPYEWLSRLDGTLFTPANGYEGPGVGTGNNVFSIGTYGSWLWNTGTEQDMWNHTDAWESWFEQHSPETERFLYLIDESHNSPLNEQWAGWIKANPGPGGALKAFATIDLPSAFSIAPSVTIVASTIYVGIPDQWERALARVQSAPNSEVYLYNGHRPASGSFALEDDGTALRELPWGQYKKHIDRWYYWQSTYYNNYLGGQGQTNVFEKANTFGGSGVSSDLLGETGWNYANGDGVLLYPGTDELYPQDSYGIDGPIASLRLKYWRRGIQDVDYLSLASAIDPAATQAIVNAAVPRVLWENGVADLSDPTWVRCDIGWSDNSDDWESAREKLADIIEAASNDKPQPTPTGAPTARPTATPGKTSATPTPTFVDSGGGSRSSAGSSSSSSSAGVSGGASSSAPAPDLSFAGSVRIVGARTAGDRKRLSLRVQRRGVVILTDRRGKHYQGKLDAALRFNVGVAGSGTFTAHLRIRDRSVRSRSVRLIPAKGQRIKVRITATQIG